MEKKTQRIIRIRTSRKLITKAKPSKKTYTRKRKDTE